MCVPLTKKGTSDCSKDSHTTWSSAINIRCQARIHDYNLSLYRDSSAYPHPLWTKNSLFWSSSKTSFFKIFFLYCAAAAITAFINWPWRVDSLNGINSSRDNTPCITRTATTGLIFWCNVWLLLHCLSLETNWRSSTYLAHFGVVAATSNLGTTEGMNSRRKLVKKPYFR